MPSPSKGLSTSNWAATVGPGPGAARTEVVPSSHRVAWGPRGIKVIKVESERPE